MIKEKLCVFQEEYITWRNLLKNLKKEEPDLEDI